jgi:hypothetical protein
VVLVAQQSGDLLAAHGTPLSEGRILAKKAPPGGAAGVRGGASLL